jgi:hypothetical protein
MVQLVEALFYKPEGRGFDSRWFHWNFSLTQSFRPHYDCGVDSNSNRNEYQEYFLGSKGGRWVELTILPSLCVDSLEMWEPQLLGSLRTYSDLKWDCFTLYYSAHIWICNVLRYVVMRVLFRHITFLFTNSEIRKFIYFYTPLKGAQSLNELSPN